MKNITTKGQRALTQVFESIADLLPPTPPEVWEVIVEVGRQEKEYNTLIYKRNLL